MRTVQTIARAKAQRETEREREWGGGGGGGGLRHSSLNTTDIGKESFRC